MTILRYERAQVVDVSQRHAVLARVAQPPLGPRLAEDRLGLPPPVCVFVDDFSVNVDAARRAGMEAFLHTSGTETVAALEVLFGRALR